MSDEIKPGTKVDVHFTTSNSLFSVEFIRGPRGGGDCFVLKGQNGKIFYISQFEKMEVSP